MNFEVEHLGKDFLLWDPVPQGMMCEGNQKFEVFIFWKGS